jgi:hypothetical protein
MKGPYLLTSYVMAGLMFAAAVWLTWDWHAAAKLPLLAYLAFCTAMFPLSRRPAELFVFASLALSPIHFSGLIAWIPMVLVFVVVWAFGIIFAPIGALLHFTGKRLAPPGDQPISSARNE